ncbi:hypothetical protein [Micromonospora peucetia]|uniref:Apea-like HEPN domain-containing protein n=1 Tax=Micromonospora peucetia TaxID=47871 RepID=A0ABZ1EJ63_9ACTN|nr:hypothetical protein [Micromonospora peucetia]WSA34280.1 hypothetical protein OIE14_09675 [Micromonospora peucetia]
MAAVLGDLAAGDWAPAFATVPDFGEWHRHGQESFVAIRHGAWQMPGRVADYRFLDTFAEMAAVRAIVAADEVLRERVDCVVGVEFALTHRQLGWTLVQHVLEPMVVAVRSYRFDQDAFDAAYNRLEDGLLATRARLVEAVPLNAFTPTAGIEAVTLPDGLVLQPMSDRQVSAAIGYLAVPITFAGGPNSVTVSQFHQWALTRCTSYPVCSSTDVPAQPAAPEFPSLVEPASRLVTALRLVCGGSVTATRAIRCQPDEDFPQGLGPTASLSALPAFDEERPTVLGREQVEAVREVYGLLRHPAVRENRGLQTALRRLVLAGADRVPTDRLIDLMVCAEVLFIKLPGLPEDRRKQDKIVDGATTLLADDPVLQAPLDRIDALLRLGYRLRNDEMHGDDPSGREQRTLTGQPTSDLSAVVDDIERVLRRALVRTISDAVKQ